MLNIRKELIRRSGTHQLASLGRRCYNARSAEAEPEAEDIEGPKLGAAAVAASIEPLLPHRPSPNYLDNADTSVYSTYRYPPARNRYAGGAAIRPMRVSCAACTMVRLPKKPPRQYRAGASLQRRSQKHHVIDVIDDDDDNPASARFEEPVVEDIVAGSSSPTAARSETGVEEPCAALEPMKVACQSCTSRLRPQLQSRQRTSVARQSTIIVPRTPDGSPTLPRNVRNTEKSRPCSKSLPSDAPAVRTLVVIRQTDKLNAYNDHHGSTKQDQGSTTADESSSSSSLLMDHVPAIASSERSIRHYPSERPPSSDCLQDVDEIMHRHAEEDGASSSSSSDSNTGRGSSNQNGHDFAVSSEGNLKRAPQDGLQLESPRKVSSDRRSYQRAPRIPNHHHQVHLEIVHQDVEYDEDDNHNRLGENRRVNVAVVHAAAQDDNARDASNGSFEKGSRSKPHPHHPHQKAATIDSRQQELISSKCSACTDGHDDGDDRKPENEQHANQDSMQGDGGGMMSAGSCKRREKNAKKQHNCFVKRVEEACAKAAAATAASRGKDPHGNPAIDANNQRSNLLFTVTNPNNSTPTGEAAPVPVLRQFVALRVPAHRRGSTSQAHLINKDDDIIHDSNYNDMQQSERAKQQHQPVSPTAPPASISYHLIQPDNHKKKIPMKSPRSHGPDRAENSYDDRNYTQRPQTPDRKKQESTVMKENGEGLTPVNNHDKIVVAGHDNKKLSGADDHHQAELLKNMKLSVEVFPSPSTKGFGLKIVQHLPKALDVDYVNGLDLSPRSFQTSSCDCCHFPSAT